MSKELYPCPICGTKCLSEERGSFDICTVCGWEEDGYQQKYPDETGPNDHWTLREARKAWKNGEALFENYQNPQKSLRRDNGER